MKPLTAILITILTIPCLFPTASAELIVGTFDSVRSGDANIPEGPYTILMRNSLLSNFPGTSFATSSTLTPEFLGGIDLLLVHPSHAVTGGIAPLSTSEQSALVDYVLNGGNALLCADGYFASVNAANSMTNPFRVSIADDGLTGYRACSADDPEHPIFNGSFGYQTMFDVYGAGVILSLGPYASSLASMNFDNRSVMAVIDRGVLGPGSGRVVIYSDFTPFADPGFADGYFANNELLFLNTIAYVVPEPSGLCLSAMGLAMLQVQLRLRGVDRRVTRLTD